MSQSQPEQHEDKSLRHSENRSLDSFPVAEPERFDPILSVDADGDDGTSDIDD